MAGSGLLHPSRGRDRRLLLARALLLMAWASFTDGALPAAAQSLTATAVIERAEARFRALKDYECTAELESRLGRKVDTGTCRFWFKQPRMLRAKITRGVGKGSEVAVDRAGTIRGRKGGLLKRFVRKMQESDPRLLTIRGASVMGLDWGSFFLKYHAGALRPGSRTVLAPRASADAPYQIQLSYPDLGKRIREVYSFDPHQWVIVEGAVYEDDVRVEHVLFREIKLDTGVADSWFKL